MAMYLPSIVALAAVATIGYMVGRRPTSTADMADRARRELKRAKAVACQLEEIADRIRKNLATHQSSIAKFKDRVSAVSSQEERAAWCDLFTKPRIWSSRRSTSRRRSPAPTTNCGNRPAT